MAGSITQPATGIASRWLLLLSTFALSAEGVFAVADRCVRPGAPQSISGAHQLGGAFFGHTAEPSAETGTSQRCHRERVPVVVLEREQRCPHRIVHGDLHPAAQTHRNPHRRGMHQIRAALVAGLDKLRGADRLIAVMTLRDHAPQTARRIRGNAAAIAPSMPPLIWP